MLAVLGVLCGYVLLRLAAMQVAAALGFPLSLGLVVGGFLLVAVGRNMRRQWASRALSRWAERNGWSAVSGRLGWPWTSDEPGAPESVVRLALTGTAGGFPVTVGEVSWAPSGMLDVAGPAKGRGFFAVLQLPGDHGRLGVRHKLRVGRRLAGQDEFDRRYWTICADAKDAVNHVGAEIKRAHVARELPEWMINHQELYVVARRLGPLTPRRATALTRQVLRIADLLGMKPH